MQKKVLLVDDETSLRRSLSLGLAQEGYQIEPSEENGISALKKLDQSGKTIAISIRLFLMLNYLTLTVLNLAKFSGRDSLKQV